QMFRSFIIVALAAAILTTEALHCKMRFINRLANGTINPKVHTDRFSYCFRHQQFCAYFNEIDAKDYFNFNGGALRRFHNLTGRFTGTACMTREDCRKINATSAESCMWSRANCCCATDYCAVFDQ
ncbi:hypothetical protein PFISCL1PPCAC_4161, partial [Pristionchus fissidentatus]